jgi:predicted DNA-binding transcriptional regulator YafY
MVPKGQKRDRTARLLRLEILLWQHPSGLEVKEIARKCKISERTVYRDLATLESELEVPIWEDGSKRGIAEGYFLPPIAFTQAEATNIFLAVRKMQYFSPLCNSSVASTFMKLNTIVPSFLKSQIQKTIDHMERLPRDERKAGNFDKLIQAWLSRHPVTIRYQEIYGEQPYETTIEPYFLEPSARNRANYVIGFCREKKTICTFIIDRILGEVKLEKEFFEIPADFDIDEYLSSAWGAFADQKVETVKLRFSKRISKALKETKFHESEIMELQEDGSLLVTLKINNTGDFQAWIMSWGKDVEVLEPETLRNKMVEVVRSLVDIYKLKEIRLKDKRVKKSGPDGRPFEITDAQWELIKPILPCRAKRGRRRADDRKILAGILGVLISGLKWHDISRSYGAYSTCHARLKSWKQQGVWDHIWAVLNYTQLENN